MALTFPNIPPGLPDDTPKQKINPDKIPASTKREFYNGSILTEDSSIYNFKKSDLGDPLKGKISWDEFAIFGNNVEKNADIFKGGIKEQNKGFADNQYEDPLYWGFSIDIDIPDQESTIPSNETSNSFGLGSPFFDKSHNGKGLGQFFAVYGNYIPEIKSRIPIYTKFYEAVTEIFKNNHTSWSSRMARPFSKNHYIYSVKNLKTLQQHGMKAEYKEPTGDNHIEFTMFEDCRMSATYLASLYNALTWSNVNMKQLIPKNLLYFKMHIRFHEIRNMTSTRLLVQELKNGKTGTNVEKIIENIKRNVSSVIYTLHDCRFDFKDSNTFGDEVKIGGWGEGATRAQDLTFKIHFNSFTKILNTTLIDPSFGIDDSLINLGLIDSSKDTGGFEQKYMEINETTGVASETNKYLGLSKSNPAWRTIYNPEKDYSTDLKSHNMKHSIYVMNNTFSRSSSVMTTPYTVSDKAKIEIKDKKNKIDKDNVSKLIQNTKDITRSDNKNLTNDIRPEDQYYRDWLMEQKNKNNTNLFKNGNNIEEQSYPVPIDNNGAKDFLANQATKIKSIAKIRGEQFLNKLKDNMSRKRAELLSNLIYKVRNATGVTQLDPPTNVYEHQGILRQYLNTVKNDIGNDIIGYARSYITKLFN